MVPDHHPFLLIEELIRKIVNCEVFSVFDITSGFWYIPIEAKSVRKTAFVTQDEHY